MEKKGEVSLDERVRGTNLEQLQFSNLTSGRAPTSKSRYKSIYLPVGEARIRLNITVRLVSRRGFDGN